MTTQNKQESAEGKGTQENTEKHTTKHADKLGVKPGVNKKPAGDSLVAKHKQEVAELNNKLLRMAAEMENVRKRSEQQISDLKKYAIADFSKEVIGVLENFHLIMNNAPMDKIENDEVVKKFFEGIDLTQKDLTKVLERNGIKRIFPVGEKFDHDQHQVINQVESDKESGTIIEVLQAGYVLQGRLLKEAMVIVAK
jgi:molecular chaperone GrpE